MSHFTSDGVKLQGDLGSIEVQPDGIVGTTKYVAPPAQPTRDGQHLSGLTNGGLSWSTVAKVIGDYYDDTANATTAETDVFTTSIPANTLAANGDKIRGDYTLAIIGHGTATRVIKVYFAGSARLTSSALTSATNVAWTVTVRVIRTGTTTARITCTLHYATDNLTTHVDVTGLDFTAAIVLKISGTAAASGAATGDITAKMGTVSFQPAA